MFKQLRPMLALSVIFLVACSIIPKEQALMVSPRQLDKQDPNYVNPFLPHTYAYFVASKNYPTTYNTYIDKNLLGRSPQVPRKIHICLSEQRGRYYVDGQVAADFPVSTGITAYPTKEGRYVVLEKKEDHTSNLYGKMYNAEGKCIDGDARPTDPVPEGGKYVGSAMPYWQRLTYAGLGLHAGKVRRRPCSHGCVRLQSSTAQLLYKETAKGTQVFIHQGVEPEAMQYKAKVIPITSKDKAN